MNLFARHPTRTWTGKTESGDLFYHRACLDYRKGMDKLRHKLQTRAALLLAVIVVESTALSAAFDEYQVKAAFLFHFTQFVDWPESAFETESSPIVIGVLGRDSFGPTLDRVFAGEIVRGRPLIVRRLSSHQSASKCQILFVSDSEVQQLNQIFDHLKGSSILTVGESDSFCPSGGMVNFVTQRDRISIEINPSAAAKAGLRINSRLLKLAKLVKDNS